MYIFIYMNINKTQVNYVDRQCQYIILNQIKSYYLILYGGCRKFLWLFGRIGPLALRPFALLRALARVRVFATFNKYPPNSMVIWWYGLIWYVLRSPLRPLARPCIFDASMSCSQNPFSPEDVIERTGFLINPHITLFFILRHNRFYQNKLYIMMTYHHILLNYTKSSTWMIFYQIKSYQMISFYIVLSDIHMLLY